MMPANCLDAGTKAVFLVTKLLLMAALLLVTRLWLVAKLLAAAILGTEVAIFNVSTSDRAAACDETSCCCL